MIRIIQHQEIQSFLDYNEELLLKNESFHNSMLGLAYSIRERPLEENVVPLYYSIIENDKVVAAGIRSIKERPFIISEMNTHSLDLLIQELISKNIELKAIVGEEKSTTYFKDQWIKIKGIDASLNLKLGVYECKKVIPPSVMKGELIQASEEHRKIVREYIKEFSIDCFPDTPSNDERDEALVNRHLLNGSLYLLKNLNNELVTMAANTRSTLNGGTISLVYTPPHFRGSGYGSNAVALLSEKIISNGKKFTNLYTDLKNPTSNSIYQKIGYVMIGQHIHWDFVDRQ